MQIQQIDLTKIKTSLDISLSFPVKSNYLSFLKMAKDIEYLKEYYF